MKRSGRRRLFGCCRDSLAFATESCFASLANCLGFHENITQPIPKEFEDYKLYDVEIRYGIVQVRLGVSWKRTFVFPSLPQLCDGLSFLHNEVKLFHRNLSPESIIINSNGAWKLAGFELCIQASPDGVSELIRFKSTEILLFYADILCISRIRWQCSSGHQSTPGVYGSGIPSHEILWYSIRYVLPGDDYLRAVQSWKDVLWLPWELFGLSENVRGVENDKHHEIIEFTGGSEGACEDAIEC